MSFRASCGWPRTNTHTYTHTTAVARINNVGGRPDGQVFLVELLLQRLELLRKLRRGILELFSLARHAVAAAFEVLTFRL